LDDTLAAAEQGFKAWSRASLTVGIMLEAVRLMRERVEEGDATTQDSALAEALQAICNLDLTELQAIIPPRGFGRD
jgi:hypothetical protein